MHKDKKTSTFRPYIFRQTETIWNLAPKEINRENSVDILTEAFYDLGEC